jgi:dipeptidyl aminopeptidase/acylaminoacyl peptidase
MGGTRALCMLPHESHGYARGERAAHCLAEMIDWLDQHVKSGEREGRGG